MTENTDRTYPYTLDVQPSAGSDRDFQWTIRKNGKVYQRSDRKYPSEAKAREQGLEVIEKLLTSSGERGF